MSSLRSASYLTRDYFAADVVRVARELIGRTLVVSGVDGTILARIVETEAYGGPDDPASHAAFKPRGRAATMWGTPGLIYVYAAYGMYPCLNIVCGPEGTASAVLIRGVHVEGDSSATWGPGRTTRRLNVTLADHGRSIGDDRFSLSVDTEPMRIEQSTRIGISRGTDAMWRFAARPLGGEPGP